MPGTQLALGQCVSLLSSSFLFCFEFEKKLVPVRFPNELLMGEGVVGALQWHLPFWDSRMLSA